MPDDLATVRLVLAALKRERVPFADAWPVALAAEEGTTVRDALDATRRSWERAYVGEPPTAAQTAAAYLFRDWTQTDAAEDRGAVELVGVRCG